jgi:hypothetical protein
MSRMYHIKYPEHNEGSKAKIIHTTVSESKVLHDLYYKLGTIDDSKYSKDELKQVKKDLSRIESDIPMFDIYSKNFYLINAPNIFTRVNNHHYRIPSIKSIEILENTLKQLDKSSSSFIDYREKIVKNINFISNFDLDVLQSNYYKLFYLSHPHTSGLTSCIKPSFISFITSKPYYTKAELINLALNMKLGINVNNDSSEEICKQVSFNDITAKEILSHQVYIQNKTYKQYVQLYTLLGAYYWNFYLRNKCFKDMYLEKQIDNLHSIIKDAPAFSRDYWVYRFIDNDSYINDLVVGSVYEENSFISTTRNPFYDPKNNLFGFILIKIRIPKSVKGVGLCIESYSLFPNEEEILMNPSRLKLVEITDNFYYFHPNPKASKRIKKLYVFEYIEPIKEKPSSVSLHYEHNLNEIKTIDWLGSRIDGDDFASKVYHFYRNVLSSFNNKRYFHSFIGKTKYLFQAFYIDDNQIYEKYFFLQNSEAKSIINSEARSKFVCKEEIYFILQNEDTGAIQLLIELRDVISVNFIHKYLGSEKDFEEEDLILFLSSMARYFGLDNIIIHNKYSSYKEISAKLLKGQTDDVLTQSNPDDRILSLYSGDFKYFNNDFINFIEGGVSRFNKIPGVTYNLKKHHIAFMTLMNASDLFVDVVKSPLYNLLLKKQKVEKSPIKLKDFYLYIHYNNFYLLPELNQLIALYNNDLFENYTDNPWSNSYFSLKSEEYLYERGHINYIETFKSNMYQDYLHKLATETKNITFNNYRLGLIV